MYSKLGNEIWKEMKAQGITQAALLKVLGMPGLRLTETLIDEQIDLHVLIMISKVLRKNFFQYLEADELDKVLQNNKANVLKGKISDLMDSNS